MPYLSMAHALALALCSPFFAASVRIQCVFPACGVRPGTVCHARSVGEHAMGRAVSVLLARHNSSTRQLNGSIVAPYSSARKKIPRAYFEFRVRVNCAANSLVISRLIPYGVPERSRNSGNSVRRTATVYIGYFIRCRRKFWHNSVALQLRVCAWDFIGCHGTYHFRVYCNIFDSTQAAEQCFNG